LATLIDVNVLNNNLLLTVAAVPLQRLDLSGVCLGELCCQGEVDLLGLH
jgi:hypothetical protein